MSVGIDLVYLPEFADKLKQSNTVAAIFTESELETFATLESRAGVFAAKEAYMKAIGKKIDWRDVWVEKQDSGKPTLHVHHSTDDTQISMSVSHAGEYVTAIVRID